MKFSWKEMFFVLFVFGFIRVDGQIELLSENEHILQNVGVGDSTGDDVTYELGSEVSFGCSYVARRTNTILATTTSLPPNETTTSDPNPTTTERTTVPVTTSSAPNETPTTSLTVDHNPTTARTSVPTITTTSSWNDDEIYPGDTTLLNYDENDLPDDELILTKNFEIYPDDSDIHLEVGDNLRIECKATTSRVRPRFTSFIITTNGSYIEREGWGTGFMITNATVDDSGSCRCTSSFLGIERKVKIIVGYCKPQLSISGKKLQSGGVWLNVTCSKYGSDEACHLELGREYDFASESFQANDSNSITQILEMNDFNETDADQQFWCTTSTSSGFQLFIVYKSIGCLESEFVKSESEFTIFDSFEFWTLLIIAKIIVLPFIIFTICAICSS